MTNDAAAQVTPEDVQVQYSYNPETKEQAYFDEEVGDWLTIDTPYASNPETGETMWYNYGVGDWEMGDKDTGSLVDYMWDEAKGVGKTAVGVGESLMTLGTGMLGAAAGAPAGAYTAVSEAMEGRNWMDGFTEVFTKTMEDATYHPRTKEGEKVNDILMWPFEQAANAGEFYADGAYNKAIEAGASPEEAGAIAATFRTLPEAALFALPFTPKAVRHFRDKGKVPDAWVKDVASKEADIVSPEMAVDPLSFAQFNVMASAGKKIRKGKAKSKFETKAKDGTPRIEVVEKADPKVIDAYENYLAEVQRINEGRARGRERAIEIEEARAAKAAEEAGGEPRPIEGPPPPPHVKLAMEQVEYQHGTEAGAANILTPREQLQMAATEYTPSVMSREQFAAVHGTKADGSPRAKGTITRLYNQYKKDSMYRPNPEGLLPEQIPKPPPQKGKSKVELEQDYMHSRRNQLAAKQKLLEEELMWEQAGFVGRQAQSTAKLTEATTAHNGLPIPGIGEMAKRMGRKESRDPFKQETAMSGVRDPFNQGGATNMFVPVAEAIIKGSKALGKATKASATRLTGRASVEAGLIDSTIQLIGGQSISFLRKLSEHPSWDQPKLRGLVDKILHPDEWMVSERKALGRSHERTQTLQEMEQQYSGQWTQRLRESVHDIAGNIPAVGGLREFAGGSRFAKKVEADLHRGLTTNEVIPGKTGVAVANIRATLRDMFEWAKERGIPVAAELQNYFPWYFDVKKIIKNPEEFRAMLVSRGLNPSKADIVIDNILNNDGLLVTDILKSRTLSEESVLGMLRGDVQPAKATSVKAGNIEHTRELGRYFTHEEMSPWLKNNVMEGLTTYMHSLVRRGISSERWGPNFEKLKAELQDVIIESKQEGSPLGAAHIRAIYDQVEMHNHTFSPWKYNEQTLKKITLMGNTAAAAALLSKAGIAALTELALPMNRSGIVAYTKAIPLVVRHNVKNLARKLYKEIPREDLNMMLEILSKEDNYAMVERAADIFNGEAKGATSKIYQAYGITGVTKLANSVSMQVFWSKLKAHAKSLDKQGKGKKLGYIEGKEVKYFNDTLEWAGIDHGTLLKWKESGYSFDFFKNNEVIRTGFSRVINSDVITSNPSQRPLWHNKRQLGLFTFLSGWPAMFTNVVLRSWYNQLRKAVHFRTGGYGFTRSMASVAATASVGLITADLIVQLKDYLTYDKGNPKYKKDYPKKGFDIISYNEMLDDKSKRTLPKATRRFTRALEQQGVFGNLSRIRSMVIAKELWGGTPADAWVGPAPMLAANVASGAGTLWFKDKPKPLAKAIGKVIPGVNVNKDNLDDFATSMEYWMIKYGNEMGFKWGKSGKKSKSKARKGRGRGNTGRYGR